LGFSLTADQGNALIGGVALIVFLLAAILVASFGRRS